MNTPLRTKARQLALRYALLLVTILAVLLGCGLVSCVGQAHAADWRESAYNRIVRREHRSYATCSRCLSGRGHGRAGYVGPLQFGRAWNKRGTKCSHGLDWRACGVCAKARFMRSARRYGKRWVARHWRATCGNLR